MRIVLRVLIPLSLLLQVGSSAIMAQPVRIADAAQLNIALKKLTVLGSALYIGAHPDDENTAVLAYMSNQRGVRSAYLSLTRGDGGQNLIGPEQSEELGLIRTQELLAARRIDGAEQFFTRAIDFGYSKSSDEALALWNREDILRDIVRIIRAFRPDIIITRFSPTMGGHGHHTASAILAREAFDAAGDTSKFPEQLRTLKPWRPRRLFFNLARFFGATIDTTTSIRVDLGEYNPLLGRSMTELAGSARTMHKSQGFGVSQNRGTYPNFFELTAGEPAAVDLFEGIDLSWKRVKGGEPVGRLLEDALASFDPDNPATILPVLLQAYEQMNQLPEDYWVSEKREELREVVRLCSGLWLEAISSEYSYAPSTDMQIVVTAINRTDVPITLKSVSIVPCNYDTSIGDRLAPNVPQRLTLSARIPSDISITQPYWLRAQSLGGRYTLPHDSLVELPENKPPVTAVFEIQIGTTLLSYMVPVQYRWIDPVDGELYRPVEITPPVMINMTDRVLMYADTASKRITLHLRSGVDSCRGTLRIRLPNGWSCDPPTAEFVLQAQWEDQAFSFEVRPENGASDGTLVATAEINGAEYSLGIRTIHYTHIPYITYFPSAEAKLVRLQVKRDLSSVGYIMGAGDEVPTSLKQIGYDVSLLSDQDLLEGNLSRFDVIVAGVRAYNTRNTVSRAHERLMNYVMNGGTYLVQYVTFPADTTLGPYPFHVSRERVTDEQAVVEFLLPAHPLLHQPNRITAADFAGWIQERGLYFSDRWDDSYQPIISCSDVGEPQRKGGLLVARYGKGVFIYTGLAFFRQLPAGVPGAYRLFVNMLESNVARSR